MPQVVRRDELQQLLDQGAQLVEVLPANEYEEDHLPGAINLPLRRLEKDAPNVLDRTRPLIVYCWDVAWDLSPRAAWRLETLGFSRVYDYTDGKLDWMAAGMPTEGTNSKRARAGDVARRDVPICHLDERLGEVRERTRAAGWNASVVMNDERVVFGLLREKELGGDARLRVEEAMRPGPSTFRPFVSMEEMAHFMTEHNLENSPVTTSDGRLVGLLMREDAVRAAHEMHQHWGSEVALHMMFWSIDPQPLSRSRCSRCGDEIDECECCEEPRCPKAICFGCLASALGETALHPHLHGG